MNNTTQAVRNEQNWSHSRMIRRLVARIIRIGVLLLASAVPLYAQLQTLLEVRGETPHTALGFNVVGLGDINGDGWPDVGVNTYDETREFRIYFGGPGILDGIPDLVLSGGKNALMADMNGDGYKDLCVVVAVTYNRPDVDTLCIYLGRPGPGLRIDTVPTIRYANPRRGSNFGAYMAAGDLNGDGFADLAVAAHADRQPGAVYVFLGRPQLDSLPDFIGRPDTTILHFPDSSVTYWSAFGEGCSIADINGDGFDDLIVGARHYNNYLPTDIGYLNLYLGRPGWTFTPLHPDQTLTGASFGVSTNMWVTRIARADIFDASNDGRADIFFPTQDSAAHPSIGIIGYGSSWGIDTTRLLVLPIGIKNRLFGLGARRIGDINGDGYRDYAFSVYLSSVSSLMYYPGCISGLGSKPMAYSYYSNNYGAYGGTWPPRVDNAGDINGDGVDDVIAGSWMEMPNVYWGYFHILAGSKGLVSTATPPELPTSVALGAAWPNPMHDACAFDVKLTAPGAVHVTIHDVLGRTVRVLEEGDQSVGKHTLQWDGRTGDGNAAVPGVYWYLIETGSAMVTGKVVLR